MKKERIGISVWLKIEQKEHLEKLAEENGLSVSDIIRWLIDKSIKTGEAEVLKNEASN